MSLIFVKIGLTCHYKDTQYLAPTDARFKSDQFDIYNWDFSLAIFGSTLRVIRTTKNEIKVFSIIVDQSSIHWSSITKEKFVCQPQKNSTTKVTETDLVLHQ